MQRRRLRVDHLSAEFLEWVNWKLARTGTLALYSFGEGMTSAHLLPVDGGRVRDVAPARSFPLRRAAAS